MTDHDNSGVAGRLDRALSSRTARIVSALVAAFALALVLFVGFQQAALNDCLAAYSDDSARSAAARSQAAGEDRKADEADRQAAEAERRAFLVLLDVIATGDQTKSRVAFANLTATYRAGDVARAATAKTRLDNERKRRDNPMPPPPNLKCG